MTGTATAATGDARETPRRGPTSPPATPDAPSAPGAPAAPVHALPAAEVWAALASRPQGLSQSEAAQRLRRYGPNAIREVRGRPLVFKLLANFTHLMALLLWAGGAVGFAAGMPQLGVAIWLVNLINGAFSFWQEYRAERATAALKRLLPAQARVLRDGEECPVPAESLVPGDVLLLAEGDHVSADARLVEEAELRVDQSTLTGESHPVRKTAEAVPQDGLARSEQPNLVFAGTTVAAGTGRAVVFATGMGTAFGTIAHLTQTVGESPEPAAAGAGPRHPHRGGAGHRHRRPLLRPRRRAGRGRPGGRLRLRHGHDRRLRAGGDAADRDPLPGHGRAADGRAPRPDQAPVLRGDPGLCTVICTDKTGTLTQNEMTVRELWVAGRRLSVTGTGYAPAGQVLEGEHPVPAGDGDLRRLLVAGALCSNARLLPPSDAPSAGAGQDPPAPGAPGASGWTVLGDPTEAALQVAARKAGADLEDERRRAPRLRELPFESRRKRMTTIHRVDGSVVAYVKGARGRCSPSARPSGWRGRSSRSAGRRWPTRRRRSTTTPAGGSASWLWPSGAWRRRRMAAPAAPRRVGASTLAPPAARAAGRRSTWSAS